MTCKIKVLCLQEWSFIKKQFIALSASTVFLLTACQEEVQPEEEIRELAEEYDLEIKVQEEPGSTPEDTAEVDYEQAEELFQYMQYVLNGQDTTVDESFPVVEELSEPVSGESSSGTYTVTIDDGSDYDQINRNISFSYEIARDAEQITSETIQIKEAHASSTGMQGHEFLKDNVFFNSEGPDNLIFYATGIWEINFLYEGVEVLLQAADTWTAPLDIEDFYEGLDIIPDSSA